MHIPICGRESFTARSNFTRFFAPSSWKMHVIMNTILSTLSLQKLQNGAACILTFSNYDVNAGQLLEILGWKNLDRQQTYNVQKANMVFKCLYGLVPDHLALKFSERNTSYNLRDSENKLNVRLPRTNYFKNSFSYTGATLWNHLPYVQ